MFLWMLGDLEEQGSGCTVEYTEIGIQSTDAPVSASLFDYNRLQRSGAEW